MAKYQKLPVIIEAWQNASNTLEPIPIWLLNAVNKGEVRQLADGSIMVNTLEGIMIGEVGDYIIQGVNGELYPCKADIFEKTYRKVEEGENEND